MRKFSLIIAFIIIQKITVLCQPLNLPNSQGNMECGWAYNNSCYTPMFWDCYDWHGIRTEYYSGNCNNAVNLKDASNEPLFGAITHPPAGPYHGLNWLNCGTNAYKNDGYMIVYSRGFGANQGSAVNTLGYIPLSNTANINTRYRVSAYVKTITGYNPQSFLGFVFVNSNVGNNANSIMNAARAQGSNSNPPIFSSVGNGWYLMTAEWTPPSTGSYFLLIGNTYGWFCNDDSNHQVNIWAIDEVSITCRADAGPDKVNVSQPCCSPQFTSVQIGTASNYPGLSYSWSPAATLNNAYISQPMATPQVTTNYTLTVSGAYCVAASDVVKVTTNAGVSCCSPGGKLQNENSTLSDESLFKFYPNPNSGQFTLQYKLEPSNIGKMIIYDASGKEISLYNLSEGENVLQVNEQSLPVGLYFYSIIVNNELIKTEKFSIEK